jgi:hypothetical protein
LPEGIKTSGQVVKVSFVDSASTAWSGGEGRQPGNDNFIKSNLPRPVSAARFDSAKVHGLYNGIDLVLYRDPETGGPRYDLVLKPGANVADIKMRYDGAQNVRTTSRGEIAFDTSLGTVTERGLMAYQTDGDGARVPVSIAPRAKNGVVSFNVATYDKSKPLVIDPVIYSTFLGGSDYDHVRAIAVDSSGNAVVSGYT